MGYLAKKDLACMGFKRLGENVKISDKASIYNPDQIELGSNIRIDDFCVVSGKITIGSHCHITPMCLIAGGVPGLLIADFCTLAYGVKIFTQSDDYSGGSMTNSLIPKKYKNEIFKSVELERQTIIGAGSIVFPGVKISEGCAVGAMSLVTRSTDPWGIYAGNPAKRMRDRRRDLLKLEAEFMKEVTK